MITTLTADKSNIIKAEGSVVTCQSETGRHVRVIRWALWEACGQIRVNILRESPLLFLLLSLAMGVQLKEYSGVTVYLFAKFYHLSAKWKIPKHSLRLILKTVNNLFESYENMTAHVPTKVWQGDRKTKWGKLISNRLKTSLMKVVGNVNSPGSKDYQTFEK